MPPAPAAAATASLFNSEEISKSKKGSAINSRAFFVPAGEAAELISQVIPVKALRAPAPYTQSGAT